MPTWKIKAIILQIFKIQLIINRGNLMYGKGVFKPIIKVLTPINHIAISKGKFFINFSHLFILYYILSLR